MSKHCHKKYNRGKRKYPSHGEGGSYINLPIRAAAYAHQRRACESALETFERGASPGYSLLMEMGTGKSLTAIAITGALAQSGRVHKALIVAPLSIIGVWREEFAKFAAFDHSLAVLAGSLAKKAETLRQLAGDAPQIAVINYESAWRLEKELLAWDADIIIADEGHRIKSHNAAVSKAMHKLGARARHRLLLTGTIVTNKALDIFSPYKFLNPAIFGSSFYSFRNRYFNMTGYCNHTPVLKRELEPELAAKMHSIAFRATKAECLDLPATTDVVRHVELEPAAEKAYRALVKDSYAELGKTEVTATNVLTRLLRLSQLTGGFVQGDDGGPVQRISAAKLSALEDIIDGAMNEDKKLVIVARFVPEIEAIRRLLEKRRIRCSLIMGGVKDREAQVAAFQTDPSVMAFVGQIATAGLGITLTAASTLVFYSLDYSMSNFEQAKARIHRVGQTERCAYVYLTAKNTVDEKILKALRDKADLAATLMDDCRNNKNPFE